MNLSKENMGLNLPMLLANPPPLDSWNAVGQFSPPPISDRSQLRVPVPMSFSASQAELNASGRADSVGGGGGGGGDGGGGGGGSGGGGGGGGGSRSLFGGSSNSDFAASPQKPMDTADMEHDDNKSDAKCERAMTPSALREAPASTASGSMNVAAGTSEGAVGGVVGDVAGHGVAAERGSSPIPNTNIHEAHKARHIVGVAVSGTRDPDDLDIKQELLVDYFHAPHPPAPPDLRRSYSSTDENRHCTYSADDLAQDLRVRAAAAAAASELDFSRFVLPPNLRHSTDSIDEKFTPLNMRKRNTASASSSTAGQMLMSSLLSNESTSEENTTPVSGRLKGSGGIGGGGGGGGISGGGGGSGVSGPQDAGSSAAAAAAAAAIYAESLNKDDCDYIGSNVTVKLRSMDRTQRIIAEKLISEVLFYGQFNELERSARIQPK